MPQLGVSLACSPVRDRVHRLSYPQLINRVSTAASYQQDVHSFP